jgi:hypothetical protein
MSGMNFKTLRDIPPLLSKLRTQDSFSEVENYREKSGKISLRRII